MHLKKTCTREREPEKRAINRATKGRGARNIPFRAALAIPASRFLFHCLTAGLRSHHCTWHENVTTSHLLVPEEVVEAFVLQVRVGEPHHGGVRFCHLRLLIERHERGEGLSNAFRRCLEAVTGEDD